MERKPIFFIVGAPRCGTTSLSRALQLHSQVCFSKPKEPHYFSQLNGQASLENICTNYLEIFFSHYQPHHRAMPRGRQKRHSHPHADPFIDDNSSGIWIIRRADSASSPDAGNGGNNDHAEEPWGITLAVERKRPIEQQRRSASGGGRCNWPSAGTETRRQWFGDKSLQTCRLSVSYWTEEGQRPG